MVVLGLTGSIGMGKSTTAALFSARNIPVHDADRVVHRLLAGEAAPWVERVFPGVSVNGQVDRARLSQRVIEDPGAMARLESILHPLVRERHAKFLETMRKQGARLVVLDVPLLFETAADRRCDVVAVVIAPAAVQRARVLARPGMTESHFAALKAKQWPDSEKCRHAHAVIDTGRGIASAQHQVDGLLRSLAACPGH